jgi:hypothetical protein
MDKKSLISYGNRTYKAMKTWTQVLQNEEPIFNSGT